MTINPTETKSTTIQLQNIIEKFNQFEIKDNDKIMFKTWTPKKGYHIQNAVLKYTHPVYSKGYFYPNLLIENSTKSKTTMCLMHNNITFLIDNKEVKF